MEIQSVVPGNAYRNLHVHYGLRTGHTQIFDAWVSRQKNRLDTGASDLHSALATVIERFIRAYEDLLPAFQQFGTQGTPTQQLDAMRAGEPILQDVFDESVIAAVCAREVSKRMGMSYAHVAETEKAVLIRRANERDTTEAMRIAYRLAMTRHGIMSNPGVSEYVRTAFDRAGDAETAFYHRNAEIPVSANDLTLARSIYSTDKRPSDPRVQVVRLIDQVLSGMVPMDITGELRSLSPPPYHAVLMDSFKSHETMQRPLDEHARLVASGTLLPTVLTAIQKRTGEEIEARAFPTHLVNWVFDRAVGSA